MSVISNKTHSLLLNSEGRTIVGEEPDTVLIQDKELEIDNNTPIELEINSDNISEGQQKEGDELLINLVQSYPVIYDKLLADYKNKGVKENAWKEIGSVMNVSAVDCQNRWMRLGQYYSKERSVIEKEYHSGAGQIKRKKWALYDNMKFLEKHMPKRTSFCNIKQNEAEKLKADDKENNEEFKSNPSTSSYVELDESTASGEKSAVNACTSSTPTRCFIGKRMKRKADPMAEAFLNINSTISNLGTKINEESADSVFGNLVAKELEAMPQINKKQKKAQILSLLYSD